ncbi:MAG: hypothetical protein ACFFDT_13750 [Candidatus Hodarchaeota archaeon]
MAQAQLISSPLDLLIVDIDTGKPALALGRDKLIANQAIAGTLAQVLCLFSEKVVQEPISLVNFSEHVMLFSGRGRYRAVTLTPSYANLVEINSKLNLVLDIIRFHVGRTSTLDPIIGSEIYTFWATVCSPGNTIYVAPRTSEGFLACLVFLTGIIHDLKSPEIEQILDNIFFLKEEEKVEIPTLIEEKKTKSIVTIAYSRHELPDLSPLSPCILAGDDSPETPFPKLKSEKETDSVARIFGSESKAWDIAAILSTEEALEVAKTVQIIPMDQDEVIKDAILKVLQSPKEDILISLSETFLVFMETLTEPVPEVSPEPLPIPTPELPLDVFPESTQEPAPDIFTASMSEIIPEDIPTPTPVTLDVEAPLFPLEIGENDYAFETVPIVLFTQEFVSNTPNPTLGSQYREKIEIRVGARKKEGVVDITVVLPHGRSTEFSKEIKSNLDDLPGPIIVQNDATIIPVPTYKLYKYIRSISWQVIIEYLIEIQQGFMEKSEAFTFPQEGAIMLIPPNREFVRKNLPRQIKDILVEKDIRDMVETTQPWSPGASVDKIIAGMVKYLKVGDGVAFIPHPEENEMEEMMLFLLLTSEIMGVAFSRW